MLSVDAANVVVEVVKEADGSPGTLVVRLYEAWGRRGPVTLHVPWDIRRAVLTDLLERPLDDIPTRSGDVVLEMAPFQITTVTLVRNT
jgi:alpha-mannosidase